MTSICSGEIVLKSQVFATRQLVHLCSWEIFPTGSEECNCQEDSATAD